MFSGVHVMITFLNTFLSRCFAIPTVRGDHDRWNYRWCYKFRTFSKFSLTTQLWYTSKL